MELEIEGKEIGGVVVFLNTRLAGWLTDRHGAAPVIAFGAVLYAAALIFGFIYPVDAIPVLVVFVGLTIAAGFRFVPMRALLSRIPGPRERARFLSAQSAVLSVGSAIGATLGAQVLSEHPDRSLTGIDDLARLAIAMTFVYSALGYAIERRVRAHIATSPRSMETARGRPSRTTLDPPVA